MTADPELGAESSKDDLSSREQTEPDADPAVVAQQRRLEARLFGTPYQAVKVGRFALLRVLGSGAMGVVHLAYDEVLDRNVAVKLLRRRSAVAAGTKAALREARAMARVSHANVVQVYEAGEYSRGVFVAMELVEGRTLREWLAGDGAVLPWRTRLEMVRTAGRGLAEAHRAGVVHRDFKPDNVLVTARGEPKVSDFGLAALVEHEAGPIPTRPPTDLDRLARTAVGIGTPSYMAPEVFSGAAADARSDQFGLCVLAYEALFRARPFPLDSYDALRDAVTEGRMRPIPVGSVDRHVAAAVVRGLSVDPARRWPSVDALVEAMAPRRRVGSGPLLGVGLIAAVTIGAIGLAVVRPEAEAPCGDAAVHLAGAWDVGRRAALEAVFTGSTVPSAPEAWTSVAAGLDAWSDEWTRQRTAACELTHVHREQSEAVLDLRRYCLDRARVRLAAAVDVLERGDDEAITRSLDIVSTLPVLDECSDVAALQAGVPKPAPHELTRVDQLAALVGTSDARRIAGDYPGARASAQQAVDGLDGLTYAPIRAAAWLALGDAASHLREDEAVVAAYERAQAEAIDAGDWELAVDAASGLGFALGARLFRFDEARRQLDVARALAARSTDTSRRARLHSRAASVSLRAGASAEAIADLRTALDLWDTLGPQARLYGAQTRENLAVALLESGALDEAETLLTEVLATQRELRGPRHPHVAHALHTLGNLLRARAQYDRALAVLDEALTLADEVAPGNSQNAYVLVSKSAVLYEQGAYEAAIALLEDGLRTWEPRLGKGDRIILMMRGNLAGVLAEMGRYAEAEPQLRAVYDDSVELYGDAHVDALAARANLGEILQLLGRNEEAEAHHRAIIDAFAAALGPRDVKVAASRVQLGAALAGQGRHDEAIAEFRVGLEIQKDVLGAEHPTVAATRNGLAGSLLAGERWAEAEAEYVAALMVFETVLPKEHPTLVTVLANVALARLAAGDAAGTLEPARRAVEMAEVVECAPRQRGDARATLAMALDRTGDESSRVPELATAALADYGELPAEAQPAEQVAELKRLLRRRG